MSFLYKTIGFMAVLGCVPASFAVTARPSVIGTASSRMPTMTAYITSGTTTTTTTTSTLLANAECIDAYTSCMKGSDACGPDFEECTTNVLFHGKMPQCLSTLAQCSTAGVSSLFGTGTVSALSTVKTKNSYGEVTEYTYPTEGSVLGQLITGAAISNRYDTSTCVKRYTACLKKDSVCGADFELCTTNTEFRKQRVYCDSTLARCQSDGLIELFGSATTSATPSASSRIGEMITEGAALAAVNAVSTCYKVVDQCILNACAANPYKCYENSTQSVISIVDAINNGDGIVPAADALAISDLISKSSISSYIKNSCLSTIGSNKYCYATFLGNGTMPTASQLRDEDNQEEIYDEAYASRMNASMKAKISDLVDDFDTKAKNKCSETIKSCVMRVCGSGSGAACYSQVFGSRDKSINNSASYEELKTGCAAVVNTDAYCKYAATNPNSTGTYSYTYVNNDAFDILFPAFEEDKDPIGVIASLNATLASSYSDAAIATMKRQCQAVATSCVKSMCGSDYQNCYRNRTDVYSSLTDTGNSTFDKSMNKVGGVLDYTIVLGLCLDTVKNASVCEEHLAIERNKLKLAQSNTTSSWGGASNVREGWIDAGSATSITAQTDQIAAIDENGNPLCTTKGGTDQNVCYSVDSAGNIYDQPVYISYTTYVESQAASTLFKDLIYDLEKEAQAKYNAKLTKEQNMCMASNSGGILGSKDSGSTFMWVKLKSTKVPTNYATAGLTTNQFAASNDIYNSFCRVRITLQSDDKDIQDVMRDGASWSTAYFAVGDSFTCGSWIPGSALEEMAQKVAGEARDTASKGYGRTQAWMTVLGTVAGGAGGLALGNSIANGKALGGLTGWGQSNDTKTSAESCVTNGTRWQNSVGSSAEMRSAYLTAMLSAATKLKSNAEVNASLNIVRQNMNTGTSSYNNSTSVTCSVVRGTPKDVQNKIDATSPYKLIDAKVTCPSDGKSTLLGNVNTSTQCSNGLVNWSSIKAPARTIFESTEVTEVAIVLCDASTGVTNSDLDNTYVNNTASNNAPVVINKGGATVATTNQNLNTAVQNLIDACSALTSDTGASAKQKAWTTAVSTVVLGAAGGVLANLGTKSVQDAKLDAVEKAAYDEFMDKVGRHIRCYVGGDEVGMYNDIISTSLE